MRNPHRPRRTAPKSHGPGMRAGAVGNHAPHSRPPAPLGKGVHKPMPLSRKDTGCFKTLQSGRRRRAPALFLQLVWPIIMLGLLVLIATPVMRST